MNFKYLSSVSLLLLFYTELLLGIPTVTSVSPVSGSVAGGNLVTITGSGFTGTTTVAFGNKNAGSFTVVSDSVLQAIAPLNAPGVIDVIVTAASGTSAANPPADYYTYQGVWFAYVPDFGSANVFPVNISTQVVGTAIPVGIEPNDVAFTPNGKLAVSVNSRSNSVTLIDVASQTPITSVTVVESFPILAITPNGQTAIIANYGSNTVTILNLITFTRTVVPVGTAPTCVAIVPNGDWAYVTNSGSSSLTQINLDTLATLTIPAGAGASLHLLRSHLMEIRQWSQMIRTIPSLYSTPSRLHSGCVFLASQYMERIYFLKLPLPLTEQPPG